MRNQAERIFPHHWVIGSIGLARVQSNTQPSYLAAVPVQSSQLPGWHPHCGAMATLRGIKHQVQTVAAACWRRQVAAALHRSTSRWMSERAATLQRQRALFGHLSKPVTSANMKECIVQRDGISLPVHRLALSLQRRKYCRPQFDAVGCPIVLQRRGRDCASGCDSAPRCATTSRCGVVATHSRGAIRTLNWIGGVLEQHIISRSALFGGMDDRASRSPAPSVPGHRSRARDVTGLR